MDLNQISVQTDHIMWQTQKRLMMDLSEYSVWDWKTLAAIREHSYEIPVYASPYVVKAKLQLAGWLKRYCFEDDVLTPDERRDATITKFLDDQLRIGVEKPLTLRASIVVADARKIIRNVLGAFDPDEHLGYCTFSRKAVVGFGTESSYLDKKICPGSPITGTKPEITWFDNYVKSDPLLYDSIKDEKSGTINYRCISHLVQSYVPKSAKIDRAVRPNTLIGSFRSIGIGRMIEKRLKRLGVDISRQQDVHKRMARDGSRRRHNVTMDLSAASDSFTPALINRLVPRRWYNELKLGRVPHLTVGGTYGKNLLYSPSFMAMGIGYTFPLMTLCYMAVLLSIQNLVGVKGRISVFGDDLIFPVKMYPYVLQILTDLGFKINEDKTFWKECFRESCGGDFYDAVDVRAASPKGVSTLLEGGYAISSYVFKLFNTLKRRWQEIELPETFGYLRSILEQFSLKAYSVPSHFPDESGFKDGAWRECGYVSPRGTPVWGTLFGEVDVSHRIDLRRPDYQTPFIPCLVQRNTLRPVGHMGIFLWEKLQCNEEKDQRQTKYGDGSDILIWRLDKRKRVKSELTGVSYRKMTAYTSRKGVVYFETGSIRVTTV